MRFRPLGCLGLVLLDTSALPDPRVRLSFLLGLELDCFTFLADERAAPVSAGPQAQRRSVQPEIQAQDLAPDRNGRSLPLRQPHVAALLQPKPLELRFGLPASGIEDPVFAHSHRRVLPLLEGAIPAPARWRHHFQDPVGRLALFGDLVRGLRFRFQSEGHQQVGPESRLRFAISMDHQQVAGDEDIGPCLCPQEEVIEGLPGIEDRAAMGRGLQHDHARRKPIKIRSHAKCLVHRLMLVQARTLDDSAPLVARVATPTHLDGARAIERGLPFSDIPARRMIRPKPACTPGRKAT